MAMVGHAMDRGGLKDPKNASNSFILKINRAVFRDLGTDICQSLFKEDLRYYVQYRSPVQAPISFHSWGCELICWLIQIP